MLKEFSLITGTIPKWQDTWAEIEQKIRAFANLEKKKLNPLLVDYNSDPLDPTESNCMYMHAFVKEQNYSNCCFSNTSKGTDNFWFS